jgi:hypothetical protein
VPGLVLRVRELLQVTINPLQFGREFLTTKL